MRFSQVVDPEFVRPRCVGLPSLPPSLPPYLLSPLAVLSGGFLAPGSLFFGLLLRLHHAKKRGRGRVSEKSTKKKARRTEGFP